MRAGDDDVGGDAAATVAAAFVIHLDVDFALRVLARRHVADLEVAQLDLHSGDALDALEDRVHRPVADRGVLDLPSAALLQADRGAGRRPGAGGRLDADQLPAAGGSALEPVDERLQIAVEDLLLAVGQRLELLEEALDFRLLEPVTQLLEPLPQRVAPAVLAEDEAGAAEADVLGPHDLVGRGVLEHAVLVDAGLVREGVLADDGLVPLHEEAGGLRDGAAGCVQLGGADVGVDAQRIGARAHGHDHFFQRAVAGALADAVDGALDLPRARLDGCETVGDGEAEVVVAVHREHRALNASHGALEHGDGLGELRRQGIADGVGDIDRRGAGLDDLLDDFDEELRLGARGVLGGELDVLAERAGDADRLDRAAHHFGARELELVLAVDGAGGEEDVHPRPLGVAQGRPGALDVGAGGAGEPADGGAAHLAGDGLHRLEVAGRGGGETGLDDVDAKGLERSRHFQFLGEVHARARRLLAVAQRGVEDGDALVFLLGMRHRVQTSS